MKWDKIEYSYIGTFFQALFPYLPLLQVLGNCGIVCEQWQMIHVDTELHSGLVAVVFREALVLCDMAQLPRLWIMARLRLISHPQYEALY